MFDFVGSNFNGFFNSGFTALEVTECKAGKRNHDDADQAHGDGCRGMSSDELHDFHGSELGDERVMRNARVQISRHHAAADCCGSDSGFEAASDHDRDHCRTDGSGQAGHRRNGGGNHAGDDHAGRKKEYAEFFQRSHQKANQMNVAFGQRNHCSKTERRADGDDQAAVCHRFVELLESDHRLQRDEGHHKAGGQQNETSFIALDKGIDRCNHNNDGGPESPCHLVLPEQ